jgi:large subunit ribosomal protein L25
MELTLDCQARPAGSKPNTLRREGSIPAVLYGHEGTESMDISVDSNDVSKLLRSASVNNTLINLNVGKDWSGKVLLREVQKHPWKGFVYHLSFFSIASQASIEAKVPVKLVGEPVGVKTDGGSMEVETSSIKVRCAPNAIPELIEIDVSEMRVAQVVHVSEVVLPEGVKAVDDPGRVIVAIMKGK